MKKITITFVIFLSHAVQSSLRALLVLTSTGLNFFSAYADDVKQAESAREIRAHIEFLASHEMKGRSPQSHEYAIASNYVATRFHALGLQPVNSTWTVMDQATTSAWFQPMTLVKTKTSPNGAQLTIAGQMPVKNSYYLLPVTNQTSVNLNVPLVFVGYGIDSPSLGINDYAGIDVQGKMAVAIGNSTPQGLPGDIAASLNINKIKMARKNGAVGLLQVLPQAEWERLSNLGMLETAPSTVAWLSPIDGQLYSKDSLEYSAFLSEQALASIFENTPTPLPAILEAATQGKALQSMTLNANIAITQKNQVDKFSSVNVLGVLPGYDPRLANEYVVLTAHLDHLGTTFDDVVFHGAIDNAAGVATLLEAARILASGTQKPRRSILFAVTTAEEMGLIGSDYLARNFPIENGHIVGVVNLDSPVLTYDFSDVIAFGAEHSTLNEVVKSSALSEGVMVSPDPLPQEGLMVRSDHYSFIRQGIPSIMLATGFMGGNEANFMNYLQTDYHKTTDSTFNQQINWEAGAKFARLNAQIAKYIANADQAPQWNPDSYFGKTYAKNTPTQKNNPQAQKVISVEQRTKGLVADSGNTTMLKMYASQGYVQRVADLRPIVSEMQSFYQQNLDLSIPFTVLILDAKDWNEKGYSYVVDGHLYTPPYGLPHVNKENIAFVPANNAGVVSQGTLKAEPLVSNQTKKLIESQGFKSFDVAAFRAVDIIALHELGHVFTSTYGIGRTTAFMDEFLANYFAYAYLVEKQPKLAMLFLATYTHLYNDFFTTQKLKYRTLQELETYYANDPNTYSWYQGQLLGYAKTIYEQQGITFFDKLKVQFPLVQGEGQKLSVQETLNRLEKIAPGSKVWAKTIFGD